MKKKLLVLALPVGLIIEGAYLVVNRFLVRLPDIVAYPILIISIGLMVTGLVYNGYCFGKHKNPFDFK